MKIDIFNSDRKYKIIYADPPWKYKESGGGSQGDCRIAVSNNDNRRNMLFTS